MRPREKRLLMASVARQKREREEEVAALKRELRSTQRRAEVADAECERRLSVAEEQRVARTRDLRCSNARFARIHVVKKQLAEVHETLAQTEAELEESQARLALAELQAKASATKLMVRARHAASADAQARQGLDEDAVLAEVQAHLSEVQEAYADLRTLHASLEEVAGEERLKAERKLCAEKRKRTEAVAAAEVEADALRARVGLDARYKTVPALSYEGGGSSGSYKGRVQRHVKSVLQGRLDTEESAQAVARGIAAAGDDAVLRLMETPEFAAYTQAEVKASMAKVAEHWSARLSVHVWDRLDLTDSKMDTLRHLLSFVFDRSTGKYVPIRIWENPNDPSDYLVMTQLVPRDKWKAEFNSMAAKCNITVRVQTIVHLASQPLYLAQAPSQPLTPQVGANGKCERDSIELTDSMYSRFQAAMRSNFSEQRPAQPILFLDATGASLGRGVTHAEIGAADFDGSCRQSRSTLAPAGLYEDSDKPVSIRENLGIVVPTYNKLIQRSTVLIEEPGGGAPRAVPALPITSADMQVSIYYSLPQATATAAQPQP